MSFSENIGLGVTGGTVQSARVKPAVLVSGTVSPPSDNKFAHLIAQEEPAAIVSPVVLANPDPVTNPGVDGAELPPAGNGPELSGLPTPVELPKGKIGTPVIESEASPIPAFYPVPDTGPVTNIIAAAPVVMPGEASVIPAPVIGTGQIPGVPTSLIEPAIAPAVTTLLTKPAIAPAVTTLLTKPAIAPAVTTLLANPVVIPASTTLLVEPTVIPAATTLLIKPAIAPAATTVLIKPENVPAAMTPVINAGSVPVNTGSVPGLSILPVSAGEIPVPAMQLAQTAVTPSPMQVQPELLAATKPGTLVPAPVKPATSSVSPAKTVSAPKSALASLLATTATATPTAQASATLVAAVPGLEAQFETGFEVEPDSSRSQFSVEKTSQLVQTSQTTTSSISHTGSQATASRIGAEAVAKFAARLASRIQSGSTKIEMRLDPPHLGRIEVKMELGADNRVQAIMTVENPEVLQDLQRNADSLRRALVQEGFDLDGNNLEFQLEQQGSGEGFDAYEGSDETASDPLDQMMETALFTTSHEIDTGHGYWLVPDRRLDIRA